MKISKIATLLSGMAVAASTYAAMDFSNMEDKMYMNVGGFYSQNSGGTHKSTFKGGGFDLALGYNISGPHNLELDLKGVFETAKANGGASNQAFADENGNSVFGSYSTYNKTTFNQFPITINYCFRHSFGNSKVGFYGGVGAGVNIIHYKTNQTYTFSLLNPPTNANNVGGNTVSSSKNKGTWVAQVFAGVSYEATERLLVSVGAVGFFTKNYTFGGQLISGNAQATPNLNVYAPQVNAKTFTWMVNGGLTWRF